MHIIYFEQEKDKWNLFVAENATNGGLLQSWQWGELAKKERQKIWPLTLKEEDRILAVALVIKENLPFKRNCFYLPRGPIVEKSILAPGNLQKILEISKIFLEELKKIGGEEKAMVIRFDLPFAQDKIFSNLNLAKLGLQRSYKDIQPRTTLVLDLRKTEEELLAQMKSKTRYNIGLAEKKNIEIKIFSLTENQAEEGLSSFFQLLSETAKRDNFSLHPRSHYQNLLETGLVKLFLAYYQEEAIAGIMVGFFGKTAVYLHGASAFQRRQLMAPYLLQWQAIKFAKENNFSAYDFGGIKSEKNLRSNQKIWVGLTRFKTGFAPNIPPTEFLGLWEYPLQPITYFAYKVLGSLVRKTRKLF